MSYEIIYDKQFIKVGDNYIPMLYWGSNNCYDYNGRRARDWSNYSNIVRGKILVSESEIISAINNQRKDIIDRNEGDKGESYYTEYSDNSFGYFSSIAVSGSHTTKTSFGKYMAIFSNGIKRALTIEQLRSNGIIVNIHTSKYGESEMIAEGIQPINEYPTTTEELIKIIELSEKKLEGTNFNIYVSFSGSEYTFKEMRKVMFPKVKRVKKEKLIELIYKIRVNGNYFEKLTSRRLFTSYNGKIFYSLNTATKLVAKLNKSYSKEFISLETIPYNKTMLV